MKNILLLKSVIPIRMIKKINILWMSLNVALTLLILPSLASAQLTSVGGATTGGATKVTAASKLNSLTTWMIDFITEIGAGISVLFALGLILGVKFGLIPTQKIKDWIVVVLAFLIVPWLLPALFTFSKGV